MIRSLADLLQLFFTVRKAKARDDLVPQLPWIRVWKTWILLSCWVGSRVCFSPWAISSSPKEWMGRWFRGRSCGLRALTGNLGEAVRAPCAPFIHLQNACQPRVGGLWEEETVRCILKIKMICVHSIIIRNSLCHQLIINAWQINRWFDICNMFWVSLEEECNTNARYFRPGRGWISHRGSILTASCWVWEKS